MTDEIREKAIEAACVEFTRGDMPSWRRWEEDERNETREAMARAIAAYERAMWRPIDEAPRNKMVLLAWRNWRTTEWENEVNHASTGKRHESGYSSISWHGEATHFRPLPAPPEDAA